MGWLANLLGGNLGPVLNEVGSLVDQFHLSGEEKQQFKLKMEKLLQKRGSEMEITLRSTLQAKERILVAELQQGDSYTKRARPSVIYAGLLFIFFNYSLVPAIGYLLGKVIPPLELPAAFWAGWSGIVATWTIGRTMEKRGRSDRLTNAITGSAKSKLLDTN